MVDLIRAAIILTESAMLDEESQVNGAILVVDYTGFHLGHFRHLVPLFRRIVHLVQVTYEKNVFCCDGRLLIRVSRKRPEVNFKPLSNEISQSCSVAHVQNSIAYRALKSKLYDKYSKFCSSKFKASCGESKPCSDGLVEEH